MFQSPTVIDGRAETADLPARPPIVLVNKDLAQNVSDAMNSSGFQNTLERTEFAMGNSPGFVFTIFQVIALPANTDTNKLKVWLSEHFE